MANSAIAGSATGLIPKRSIKPPNTGVEIVLPMLDIASADENVPRLQPRSCVTGTRNTPKVNTMIEPVPTVKPTTDAATTHHRFCRMPGSATAIPPNAWAATPYRAALAASIAATATPLPNGTARYQIAGRSHAASQQ